MDEYIEKHLNDVLLSIEEVESYFTGQPKLFENFKKDILRQRAIVNTRNRVIHGYDSVTTEFLWSLILKHIPALKEDILAILK